MITVESKIQPLGQLLQNEPHLRRHVLRLLRNANFNYATFVAINGGVGCVVGEGFNPAGSAWPDEQQILARTERPDESGSTSPWVFCSFSAFTDIFLEFPDLSIGPTQIADAGASWTFNYQSFDLPVGVWHRAVITTGSEPSAKIAWLAWGESPLSAAALTPADTPPLSLVAPVIYGTELVGETLTCSPPGTWSGFPAPTYAYQWYQAPSTLITGADSFQYVVQSGDAGLDLFCRVTATNTAGTADADSNSLSIPTGTGNRLVTDAGDGLVTNTGDRIVWA